MIGCDISVGMEKVDFRKHEVKVQEAFRARAVRLVEEEGYTQTRAAEVIGVSRQTVSGWIIGYRKQGKEFLQDRRKNEHKKSARILSDKEMIQVKNWVKDLTPLRGLFWRAGKIVAEQGFWRMQK